MTNYGRETTANSTLRSALGMHTALCIAASDTSDRLVLLQLV
jgi:hypothetical protein